MRRVLEAIFRHPIQLFALIIVLPIVGLAVAYVLPRSYQTTASLWALRRYQIIGATGPETDLLSTPAETQVAALSELLQSRSFDITVAQESNLASTLDPGLRANPQRLGDALFDEISHNVRTTAQGYNLYTVTYTNHNPKIAEQVITAVIHNYGLQSQNFSVDEGKRLLESYKIQLANAQQTAKEAAATEASYVAAHPNLSSNDLQTDPQYVLLHAQTLQAQNAVTGLQSQMATINQALGSQGVSSGSFFSVVDAPLMPNQPVSRVRDFLVGGGIGLGVALVAGIVYILVLIRRNYSVYTPLDLQKGTPFPVIMQLPRLSKVSVSLLAQPVPADIPS